MTLIHFVLFKFRSDVSPAHKSLFVSELKTLKALPSVLNSRLLVGGPSITDPIERSKGFGFALVSYHRNREALAEYHASKEHRATSTHLFPFVEDLVRFDFEVDSEDEYMCRGVGDVIVEGNAAREVSRCEKERDHEQDTD